MSRVSRGRVPVNKEHSVSGKVQDHISITGLNMDIFAGISASRKVNIQIGAQRPQQGSGLCKVRNTSVTMSSYIPYLC